KIKIAERLPLTRIRFKKRCFCRDFIGRRDRIVARTGDFSRAVFRKLKFAELEQTNVGSCPLLWVEIRLDLRNRLHERKIHAERFGRSFDLLKRSSYGNV